MDGSLQARATRLFDWKQGKAQEYIYPKRTQESREGTGVEEGTGGTDDYQRGEPTKRGSKTHRNAQRPQSNLSIYTCCLYYFSNTTKVLKLLFTCIRKDKGKVK